MCALAHILKLFVRVLVIPVRPKFLCILTNVLRSTQLFIGLQSQLKSHWLYQCALECTLGACHARQSWMSALKKVVACMTWYCEHSQKISWRLVDNKWQICLVRASSYSKALSARCGNTSVPKVDMHPC